MAVRDGRPEVGVEGLARLAEAALGPLRLAAAAHAAVDQP